MKGHYCFDKIMIFAVGISAVVLLLLSWMVIGYIYQRLLAARGMARGMSKINVAKAIGRRMSSMLNIQTGYDVNGHKVLYSEQEEDQISERKSVLTVSIYTQTEFFCCTCGCHARSVSNNVLIPRSIRPGNITSSNISSTITEKVESFRNVADFNESANDSSTSHDEADYSDQFDSESESIPDRTSQSSPLAIRQANNQNYLEPTANRTRPSSGNRSLDSAFESMSDNRSQTSSREITNPNHLKPTAKKTRPTSRSGRWRSIPEHQLIRIEDGNGDVYDTPMENDERGMKIYLPEQAKKSKKSKKTKKTPPETKV